jgi:hypothetical protein
MGISLSPRGNTRGACPRSPGDPASSYAPPAAVSSFVPAAGYPGAKIPLDHPLPKPIMFTEAKMIRRRETPGLLELPGLLLR